MSDIDEARQRVRTFLAQWVSRDDRQYLAVLGDERLVLEDVRALLGEEEDGDTMMTPSEVAEAFGVDPKTVTRWARRGRIQAVRTPGGHRRFRRSDIVRLVTPHTEQERA